MVLYYGITGSVYQLARVEKTSDLMEAAASLYSFAAGADPGSQADTLFQSVNPLSNNWDPSFLLPAQPQPGGGMLRSHGEPSGKSAEPG